MPRFKQLLEFDEDEKDVLRAASSVKMIVAVTKPYVDQLKELAKDIQKVVNSKHVDPEGLGSALESAEAIGREMGQLPDSETKSEFLEKLEECKYALREALEMAQGN